VSAGASLAGGSARTGGAGGGRVRASRCCLPMRPVDPHVDRDLRRKLPDRTRSMLDDLQAALSYRDRRLETIAARHYERL